MAADGDDDLLVLQATTKGYDVRGLRPADRHRLIIAAREQAGKGAPNRQ